MNPPALSSLPPPWRLDDFPHAIIHFDGDAFFTSVEQALNPALRGRPVVTGKERGIIACASYEAKALGIRRGLPLWEARRRCPDLVVLPSDYETYSLMSLRMFEIVRRFTPMVEEHSIDEGFADLTGLRRLFRDDYLGIARRIQTAIADELGLTVSIGLSLTKSLAKLASDLRKPAGLTAVPGIELHRFLADRPLEEVWGFGPNTVALLHKHGLRTALDFVRRPATWAQRLLGKIGLDIWNELRGDLVYPVQTAPKPPQVTISKGKTFTAPSIDREFIYARLIRNAESAFIKLRRHHLRARSLLAVLVRQDFRRRAAGARFDRATAAIHDALPALRTLFDQLHEPNVPYRATMVVLSELEPDHIEQPELFEDRPRIERMTAASRVMDAVRELYGKHRLALGTALFLPRHPRTDRDEEPWRHALRLPGETARRRLGIPVWRITV
ncbi:MAG: DNA polymerase IV [Kiritimatiellae bacterium]|nr:DNA polymerase IV [Kiritimatiellia bacterium]